MDETTLLTTATVAAAFGGALLGALGSWFVQRHSTARLNRGEATAAYVAAAEVLEPLVSAAIRSAAEEPEVSEKLLTDMYKADEATEQAGNRLRVVARPRDLETIEQLSDELHACTAIDFWFGDRDGWGKRWEEQFHARGRLRGRLAASARRDLVPWSMRVGRHGTP